MAKNLDRKRLAPHRARSVASITIKARTPEGKEIDIGAVRSMERRMSRNMTRRRELDSDPPGATIEIIPGAVTTFELTIRRAMLYKASMLEEFGIGGIEDLIQQNIPLEIIEERHSPSGQTQIVTYTGCYFKDNPLSIDIEGDWIIVQDATLEVASAKVTGGPQTVDISPDSVGGNFQVSEDENGPFIQ